MIAGLVLGVLIGLVAGPWLRAWLVWRACTEICRSDRRRTDPASPGPAAVGGARDVG